MNSCNSHCLTYGWYVDFFKFSFSFVIYCYNVSSLLPEAGEAGDLGQEAMGLLSVFGRNFVPIVRDKPEPADGEVEV